MRSDVISDTALFNENRFVAHRENSLLLKSLLAFLYRCRLCRNLELLTTPCVHRHD
jgi:hypothetical protein